MSRAILFLGVMDELVELSFKVSFWFLQIFGRTRSIDMVIIAKKTPKNTRGVSETIT